MNSGRLFNSRLSDLTPSEQFQRNYNLDLGLDPDNPGVALVDSAGLPVSMWRNQERLLRSHFQPAGARRLNPVELGEAKRGSLGDGSAGDDVGYVNYFIPAGQHRPMRSFGMIADEVERQQQGRQSTYGFDPFASPEDQARQLREGIAEQRSRQSHETGRMRENFRRLDAGERGTLRISSGGTMQRGGQSYRVPMGGGPRFETAPIEAQMTPDEFVRPNPVGRAVSAVRSVTPLAEDGGSGDAEDFGATIFTRPSPWRW